MSQRGKVITVFAVNKLRSPTDENVAMLRREVQDQTHRLHYQHLPDWGSRPLHIVRENLRRKIPWSSSRTIWMGLDTLSGRW